MSTPIYDDLVIEREGRPSDADLELALTEWAEDMARIEGADQHDEWSLS